MTGNLNGECVAPGEILARMHPAGLKRVSTVKLKVDGEITVGRWEQVIGTRGGRRA